METIMAKKVALLIGVSKYGEGIPSLSAPINDIAAMKRVLENPNMGGFDQVKKLENPDPTAMRLAVQQTFANCRKDDLVLLFFSGHGITDDNNKLYLATKGTSKDFYKATSVPASFIQDVSLESYAKRQAIVLDCCYSGAFAEGWQAKSVGLDLKRELGGEGRVVLTSSTAYQKSFQQESDELSLYTKYLAEGIETGAADQDKDGKISVYELHEYAKAKVQQEKPKQRPGIIIDKEGFSIIISQAPVDDPELDFRKLVEKYAVEDRITTAGKYILQVKCQELNITKERADEIVDDVLAPYRKRLEHIELYKEAYKEAVEQSYPLTERLLDELQDLQNVLGLENKDIEKIRQEINSENDDDILEEYVRSGKEIFEQSLELRDEYAEQKQIEEYELKARLVAQQDLLEKFEDIIKLLATRNIQITNTADNKYMTETNKSKYDLSSANVGGFVDTAQGESSQKFTQNNYISQQKQTLAQAATEIQKLLENLEQSNPNATVKQKQTYVDIAISPTLKAKCISALQAGGEAAIDEFLSNPYIKVLASMIRGWTA